MIISRQTQLHKLHTSIYLCVFVRVCSSVPTVFVHTAALVNMLHPLCDCALAAARVESRVRKWDFSCCSLSTFFFVLLFFYSAPLPPTFLAHVVLTIPHTPDHSSSCFFFFVFLLSNFIYVYFLLIVLHFCFIFLLPFFCFVWDLLCFDKHDPNL